MIITCVRPSVCQTLAVQCDKMNEYIVDILTWFENTVPLVFSRRQQFVG